MAKASRRCASYVLSKFSGLFDDCVLVGEPAERTLSTIFFSWALCEMSGACARVRAKSFGARVASLYEAPIG